MSTRSLIVPLIVFLSLFLAAPAFAQSSQGPDMEWGSVTAADLAMKSYAPDTNAAAVVLFDYGETKMNNELGLAFTHHRRIKILSKAGYEWGTVTISLYTDDHSERISRIKGATYVTRPDGSIETIDLDDNSIFEEEYDNKYTRYKFTLPGLQPGCVIEYSYMITAKSLFNIKDWIFQKTIPVLWSEYRVTIPRSFAYVAVKRGYQIFHVEELTEETGYFSGRTAGFLYKETAKCNTYRWVLKNAPALREEPYITTLEDYAQRVHLQLAEYVIPGGGVQRVLKTWEMVVDELNKDNQVVGAIDDTRTVRKATESVIAGLTTPEEKMTAIYNFVRNRIVWSGEYRWTASQDVDDVLESKKGSSAEITYLLLSMMKSAGIEGHPVMLSTRGNGKTQEVYPIISEFNYVLAYAKIGKTGYFLDATDPYRPMDILPTRVLNTRGLILKEGTVEWATIRASKYYEHNLAAKVTISADGAIDGTIESTDKEYAAIKRRKDLTDGKEADVIKKMLDADRVSLTVDSISVIGKDSVALPLTIKAHFSAGSYAQAAGDVIYLNPFVVGRQYENPFKLPTRSFPIDMTYPQKAVTQITLTIPEGYEIKEMPVDKVTKVGVSDATFSRFSVVNGQTVTVTSSLEIARTEFPPNSYSRLKDFFEQITSWEGEQIVLQRRVVAAAVKEQPQAQKGQRKGAKDQRKGPK